MKTLGYSLLIFGIALLSPGAALADIPLTLTNASFEIQNAFDNNNGCGSPTPCYNSTIVDWNQFGGSGTFDPTLAVPAIAPPALSGKNVAYLNSGGYGGSYITQDLGTLAAGTYDISIAVASRGPAGADSTPALYRLGVDTGGTAAAPTWNTDTLTQISGSAPLNPTLDSDIWSIATLRFTSKGIGVGDYYAFISADGATGGGNSQLEVDASEPSALLLLAAMVMVLAAFVRMKFFRVV